MAMRQVKQQGNGDWLTRERTLILVLAAVTVVVFYLCYRMAVPFLSPLTWALSLAVIAHPLHAWIRERLRRESLAAGLAVLVVTAVLIAPALFVGQQIASEATTAVEQVQKGVTQGRWKEAIEKNPRLASALEWMAREVNLEKEVKQASESISDKVGGFVSGTIAVASGILVTLFLLFYFFRDGQKLIASVRDLIPLSDREAHEVFHSVRDTIGGIVYGTLVVAAIQGALGGLMFWWLGLPGPILWGAVMAILAGPAPVRRGHRLGSGGGVPGARGGHDEGADPDRLGRHCGRADR
jgi:predicted PurR-regulated permease PerM